MNKLVLVQAVGDTVVQLVQVTIDITVRLVQVTADTVLETADTESVLVLFWLFNRLAVYDGCGCA